MNDRDHHRTSSDAQEESEDQATEPPRRHGLRLVPTPPTPVIKTPADEELRELLEEFKRRAEQRKKTGDDPPPAA